MRDMLVVLIFIVSLTGAGIGAFAAITAIQAWRRRLQRDPGELDALHDRIAETEALEVRLVELEERVEFAERMLAQRQEQEALPAPSPPDRH